MNESARLQSIREDIAAVAPGLWSRAADGDGELILANGPMGEIWTVARLDPGATDAEVRLLAGAVDNMRFLLGLVDRAIAALKPKPTPAPATEKNYAAEAAMKCAEPAFKAFLEAEHGLERPLTDDRCAQKVRTLCGVTSRSELKSPGRAAEAWQQLRGDFEAWKRRERR